jgi:hypothetical protein
VKNLFRDIHAAVKAYFVFHLRKKEVLRVYRVCHAQELRDASPEEWPMVRAQHALQISQIKQGRLVTGNPIYAQQQNGQQITDRRSWQWPFMPASVSRMSVPLAKIVPYNIRRISRTPVPRRAINLVKGAVISQAWDIAVIDDVDHGSDIEYRKSVLKTVLAHPNNDDSFQTWMEASIEDFCCFGAFATEIRITPDPDRPIKMWPVNIESIRIFPTWTEGNSDDMPRYAQMTGLQGERGAIIFYNDQLLYVRDNPSTDTPFGLGRVEVAFQSLNYLLGIQEMSGRAGSDQIHKTWLWWEQPQTDAAYNTVRRHIQNELEGQSKVSIIGGMKKPEVIEIQPMQEGDLLLPWQEMLIRMVANAFDLSAMALGLEQDVNRAVGTVLNDKDFRSAIVPFAKRLEDAITRQIIHDKLGWYDLSFKFLSLDDPDIETKIDIYQRAYAMNATNPNEFRIAMGWKPSPSPFADLTQFEAMLFNAEATARIQIWTQKQLMQLQQSPDQGPPPMGFPPTDDGSGGGYPPAPGDDRSETPPSQKATPAINKDGQPTPPKALKLPQFPVSASKYTAQDIAAMSLDQLVQAFDDGELPPTANLVEDMDRQDPTILDSLEESVRQFLQQRVIEENKKLGPQKASSQMLKELKQHQQKLLRDDVARQQDMTKWLYRTVPKPKTNQPGLLPAGGRPGRLNERQK